MLSFVLVSQCTNMQWQYFEVLYKCWFSYPSQVTPSTAQSMFIFRASVNHLNHNGNDMNLPLQHRTLYLCSTRFCRQTGGFVLHSSIFFNNFVCVMENNYLLWGKNTFLGSDTSLWSASEDRCVRRPSLWCNNSITSEGFWRNLILENFTMSCSFNSLFIYIPQK